MLVENKSIPAGLVVYEAVRADNPQRATKDTFTPAHLPRVFNI